MKSIYFHVSVCSAAALYLLGAPLQSKAFQLVFSSPNVLSGINGVLFTLPSSGETKPYNVKLEFGNTFDVYGNPPLFDVLTSKDAEAAMEESAIGLDFYLQNISADLSFYSAGTDIFYIPYGFDPSSTLTSYWSSGKKINGKPQINVVNGSAPSSNSLVFARLEEVPGPIPVFGVVAMLGASRKLRRRLKVRAVNN
jgi:hypothetical protein